MCTVIILRRPNHKWPMLVAANRDEMLDRPWRAPARHWPDAPHVTGGLDELGGGTWLGLNDDGVLACVLNRHGTLGPLPGKRSRGELVLDALGHADARDAARALTGLDPRAFRAFNMVIADNRDGFWLRLVEGGTGVEAFPLPLGLAMLTAHDLNAATDARVRRFRDRFAAARPPDPDGGDWDAWKALCGEPALQGGDARAGMCFKTDSGFGTSSGSLLALPAPDHPTAPVWLFAAGPPCEAPYETVAV